MKNVNKDDNVEDFFTLTVQHIEGEDNLMPADEYKANEMLKKEAPWNMLLNRKPAHKELLARFSICRCRLIYR